MIKKELTHKKVNHIDIKTFDSRSIIAQYRDMAFQARNLANAADIYQRMLQDEQCTIILGISGSLISAGLQSIFCDLIEFGFVDVIVATGANIIDQDFFEALGFSHYQGDSLADDRFLLKHGIDRIYDTYIKESELRICDKAIFEIAEQLIPRPYSSREFILAMGSYLAKNDLQHPSLVASAYGNKVPIFVPAFSDSSAGFGLVEHQVRRLKSNKGYVSIDSVQDFRELTELKINSSETGILLLGGGVPKNFIQDIVVAADILGKNVSPHKYAIQITVADERDGGLSGSTLREAHSWGKVDINYQQMVFSEITLSFPLIASYVYHNGVKRQPKRLGELYQV